MKRRQQIRYLIAPVSNKSVHWYCLARLSDIKYYAPDQDAEYVVHRGATPPDFEELAHLPIYQYDGSKLKLAKPKRYAVFLPIK